MRPCLIYSHQLYQEFLPFRGIAVQMPKTVGLLTCFLLWLKTVKHTFVARIAPVPSLHHDGVNALLARPWGLWLLL